MNNLAKTNSPDFWRKKEKVLLNSFPTLSGFLSSCIEEGEVEKMEKFLLALFVSDLPMEEQKQLPN